LLNIHQFNIYFVYDLNDIVTDWYDITDTAIPDQHSPFDFALDSPFKMEYRNDFRIIHSINGKIFNVPIYKLGRTFWTNKKIGSEDHPDNASNVYGDDLLKLKECENWLISEYLKIGNQAQTDTLELSTQYYLDYIKYSDYKYDIELLSKIKFIDNEINPYTLQDIIWYLKPLKNDVIFLNEFIKKGFKINLSTCAEAINDNCMMLVKLLLENLNLSDLLKCHQKYMLKDLYIHYIIKPLNKLPEYNIYLDLAYKTAKKLELNILPKEH